MIKLNLLPPSLDADRKRNIAIAVVVLLLAAEGGALVVVQREPARRNQRLAQRVESANQQKQSLDKYGSDVGPILAKERDLAPRRDFMMGLITYNKAYPGLYKRAAGYTFGEVTLLNLEASANQLKFDAYVSNPADVSRLLMGLSRNPDFQGLPTITNLPGYDEEEQRRRQEDQRTQETMQLPESTVIGAYNPNSDLPPGYGGGGAPGAPGMPGSDSGLAGNGPGGGMPMGGVPMGLPSMGGAGGNGPGGGAEGSGGGGGTGDLSKFRLDAAKRKPRGFTVTVTCALKNPISRPSYGTSDSQAGSGGGGGGGGFGGNGPGGGFSGGSMNGP